MAAITVDFRDKSEAAGAAYENPLYDSIRGPPEGAGSEDYDVKEGIPDDDLFSSAAAKAKEAEALGDAKPPASVEAIGDRSSVSADNPGIQSPESDASLDSTNSGSRTERSRPPPLNLEPTVQPRVRKTRHRRICHYVIMILLVILFSGVTSFLIVYFGTNTIRKLSLPTTSQESQGKGVVFYSDHVIDYIHSVCDISPY